MAMSSEEHVRFRFHAPSRDAHSLSSVISHRPSWQHAPTVSLSAKHESHEKPCFQTPERPAQSTSVSTEQAPGLQQPPWVVLESSQKQKRLESFLTQTPAISPASPQQGRSPQFRIEIWARASVLAPARPSSM